MSNNTSSGPWATLTLGLGLVSVGALTPLLLLVLLLSALFFPSDWVMRIGVMCFLALILGVLGQILCFFTPLTRATKFRLGFCFFFGCLTLIESPAPLRWVCVVACMLCHGLFLLGLCRDLDCCEARPGLNWAALLGVLATLMLAASNQRFYLACAGLLVAFVAWVFYAKSVVWLTRQAHQIRRAAADCEAVEPGFSRAG
jgi:hypothetical protein